MTNDIEFVIRADSGDFCDAFSRNWRGRVQMCNCNCNDMISITMFYLVKDIKIIFSIAMKIMMMIRTWTTLIYCQVSTLPDLVQSFMNNPEILKLKQQQQLSVRKHHQQNIFIWLIFSCSLQCVLTPQHYIQSAVSLTRPKKVFPCPISFLLSGMRSLMLTLSPCSR